MPELQRKCPRRYSATLGGSRKYRTYIWMSSKSSVARMRADAERDSSSPGRLASALCCSHTSSHETR
eukprot:5649597-Pyramimonas_sp.AAC.1